METAPVASEQDLRSLYRPPSSRALDKQIPFLDEHCRTFIQHSPLLMLATAGVDGSCDVSPKGGAPGFVSVLSDHRLAIPDLAGNNRLDSMTNVVNAGGAALLFLIPGLDETLRVNGRAHVSTDTAVLDACTREGLRPRTAIVLDVEEAYIHCAKAFRRAEAWDPSAWPDRSDMPSIGCMLRDHAGMSDVSADDVDRALEDSYARTLWKPGGASPERDGPR